LAVLGKLKVLRDGRGDGQGVLVAECSCAAGIRSAANKERNQDNRRVRV
jgi:hypothetical protein